MPPKIPSGFFPDNFVSFQIRTFMNKDAVDIPVYYGGCKHSFCWVYV